MNRSIQPQNVYERKRAIILVEAIYIEIYGYDFDPGQLLEWAEELVVRIQAMMALEPISEADRMVMEMAADGIGIINCIKTYRELTGEGLRDAKAHVEAICNEYFNQ